MNEFSIINTFFQPLCSNRSDIIIGIGDDAACLQIPEGRNLLVSTDTLVADTHFLSDWNPFDIAYRSAMTCISDLAAMAAEPAWATLALTLPAVESEWLKHFSLGLSEVFSQCNMSLIGGDTTKGPLSITLTVFGFAPCGQALRRSGAKLKDHIFVTGYLGAAAFAIEHLEVGDKHSADYLALMQHLMRPRARIDWIQLLRQYASSAIDISDGLSADLAHICKSSRVGALINENDIPIHPLVTKHSPKKAMNFALTGGDDYELCFTIPQKQLMHFNETLKATGLVCYPIGIIEETQGLRMNVKSGKAISLVAQGYTHF